MATSGGGGGGGWVPGHSMPPLGFGVVPQQPGGGMAVAAAAPSQLATMAPMGHPSTQFTWHHHQFIASQQMGMAGSPVGVQPLTQQQQQPQHFQRFPQHLHQQQQNQQQWAEAQRKAAEEQRKLYEQMMKQRQFDEQKMRLKAFNASKKSGVSADTMIESILGSKDTVKPRSPQPPKKTQSGGNENQLPASHPKQGSAVDWTKMDNMNQLFAPESQVPSVVPTGGMIPQPGSDLTQPSPCLLSSPTTDFTPTPSLAPHDHPRLPPGQAAAGPGTLRTPQEGKMEGKPPVVLPEWLSDKSRVPEVYQRAVGLVEGQDGWIDTSRAHMLLLRTGLPPPLLGLLWEMANCTRPGQLTQQEFTALLGLVALVQTGQAVTSREVLGAFKEPLLPILDHPVLLPLVQDYIKHRQQLQQQQLQQQQQQQQASQDNGTTQDSSQQLPQSSASQFNIQQQQQQQGLITADNKSDDDEFDDFVSVGGTGMSTCNPVFDGQTKQTEHSPPSQPPLLTPTPMHHPLMQQQQQLQPEIPTIDKMKAMNLPKVGVSPEMSPTTSFDHTGDDEFDEFQSAGVSVGASLTFMGFVSGTGKTSAPQETPNLMPLQPEESGNVGDKYAVFRELETSADPPSSLNLTQPAASESDLAGNVDDSFGDFCSSEPVNPSHPQSSCSSVLSVSSAIPGTASFPPILPQTTTGSGTNNTSPISFEIYSTPPEALPETNVDGYFEADFGSVFDKPAAKAPDNYADIHEAMKRAEQEQRRKAESEWNDPFGEFEEAPSLSAANSSFQPGPPDVPQLNVDGGGGDGLDDDFGDFMGPGGIGEVGGGGGFTPGQNQPLGLSENLAETQSVASLELPGLEVTVGMDCQGNGSNQSPDLTLQHRNDGSVEDQLRGLSLDPTPGNNGVGKSSVGVMSQPSPAGLDTFSGGLVDRYSSIRDEAAKGESQHDEAHTGSWERCLTGCIGLLSPAAETLNKLNTSPHLKAQVLDTSQMLQYLADVREVWQVCERIASSSHHVTTSNKVDQLLVDAARLWDQISAAAQDAFDKVEKDEGEGSQLGDGEVCGVCLGGGGSGGGRLVYGGHCYHPPCANLWLNCVDLLLPSLTPVTLL